MFCQEVSSVLLSDRSGNDMLCSILFLSMGFNVLTDYFYWGASSCQQTETLTPKGFFPKLFPDFRILLFQQSATGTFISIDKFTKFCSQLRTEHYMHMINVMVLLYHRPHYRTSVLFYFYAIHLPPVEEREFLLYYVKNFMIK